MGRIWAQVIKRKEQVFIWSRGEELVTDRFPEIAAAAAQSPDGTVLDGEILAWEPGDGGRVQSFGQLQRRLGRKTIGKKLLKEVPVILMTYDLLEWENSDIRTTALMVRRSFLEKLLNSEAFTNTLLLSPVVAVWNWQLLKEKRQESRDRHVEGVMLKKKQSLYGVGRKRGDWWK